jgi:protein TonB
MLTQGAAQPAVPEPDPGDPEQSGARRPAQLQLALPAPADSAPAIVADAASEVAPAGALAPANEVAPAEESPSAAAEPAAPITTETEAVASPPLLPVQPPALFAGFLAGPADRRTARWIRRGTVAASVAAHAVLLLVGVAGSFWRVDELHAPRVAVTFLTLPTAPPPPPPAKTAARAAPKPHPRPVREVQQPRAVTQPVPPPESDGKPDDEEQAGEREGTEGGVAGGVVGSVLTSAVVPALRQLSPSERREMERRYLEEVLRPRIAAHASLPPEAQRLGIVGRVVMQLSISAAGQLIAVRPAAACPHEILCEAAAAAIKQAAPFPPPPAALLSNGRLEPVFPLNYVE